MSKNSEVAFETLKILVNAINGGKKYGMTSLASELLEKHTTHKFDLDFIGLLAQIGDREALLLKTKTKLEIKVLHGNEKILLKLGPERDFKGACFVLEKDHMNIRWELYIQGGVIEFNQGGLTFSLFFNPTSLDPKLKDFNQNIGNYFAQTN